MHGTSLLHLLSKDALVQLKSGEYNSQTSSQTCLISDIIAHIAYLNKQHKTDSTLIHLTLLFNALYVPYTHIGESIGIHCNVLQCLVSIFNLHHQHSLDKFEHICVHWNDVV